MFRTSGCSPPDDMSFPNFSTTPPGSPSAYSPFPRAPPPRRATLALHPDSSPTPPFSGHSSFLWELGCGTPPPTPGPHPLLITPLVPLQEASHEPPRLYQVPRVWLSGQHGYLSQLSFHIWMTIRWPSGLGSRFMLHGSHPVALPGSGTGPLGCPKASGLEPLAPGREQCPWVRHRGCNFTRNSSWKSWEGRTPRRL